MSAFTTVKLSNGEVITINKIFGVHLFNAIRNGKLVDMDFVHALSGEDVFSLFEAINLQVLKLKIQ